VPDGAQWVRINDLFHAAIAKPAAARAPFLSEQCGSDALLRVEVESLLAAHRKGQTDVRPGAVAVGSRPGDYEVTGFIAEGEVYRARDTKLGQMLLSAPAHGEANLDTSERFCARPCLRPRSGSWFRETWSS
jgi:hypothetical protein